MTYSAQCNKYQMKKNHTFGRKYLSHYTDLSKACWQSVFMTFIESLATGICFFLSIYFVNVLHTSIATAGVAISFYGIGTICGGMSGGKLSDHMSAKTVSVVCLLIQSIAFYSLSLIENKTILMLNMFIVGICTYGFMTANDLWLLRQCQNQATLRLKCININRAASNLGMGVSGIMIGFVNVTEFRHLFYFSSVVLFLSALYFCFFAIETIKHPLVENADRHDVKLAMKSKHNRKIFLYVLCCLFLIGLIIAQLSVTYPIYIQNAFPQMGTKAISILFILDTLLIVILQAPLVNTLKNINSILLVGVGALLMGLGMFTLNFSIYFYMAIISCLIWTTGEMIFITMAQLVCYECGIENKKGHTMGIYQATYASSRVIGPMIGGYIYYHFSGNALWSLSFLVGLLCFTCCLCIKKYDYVNC